MSIYVYLDVFLVSKPHITDEISVYGVGRDGEYPRGNIGDGHWERTGIATREDNENASLNGEEGGDSKWIVEIFVGCSTKGS